MRPLTRVALALALTFACTAPVRAADAPARPALATQRTDAPVRIDGVLDEAAWVGAPETQGFTLIGPREGQAPDESTTVRVLQDGDRVVFGIWCQAKRAPHAGLAPRDQITDGDHLSLHLDTDGDGSRAYIFGVNPYGVQLDGILTGGPDFKWDGVWDAAAHRGNGEWTAEISVPFRIMRISAAGRPWRLWVRREITAWNEVSSWPLYRTGTPGPRSSTSIASRPFSTMARRTIRGSPASREYFCALSIRFPTTCSTRPGSVVTITESGRRFSMTNSLPAAAQRSCQLR